MATRFVTCRHTVTEGEQKLPARAVALGMFPGWEPVDADAAAVVAALKPASAVPDGAPEPGVEPAPAPVSTRKRKAATGEAPEPLSD